MEFEKYKKQGVFWSVIFPCIMGLALCVLYLCNSCSCKDEPHWSHKACVEEIAERLHLTDYVYTVKEVDDDYEHGDGKVYCFEITVRAKTRVWEYYCCAVVNDGEVVFVDCYYMG